MITSCERMRTPHCKSQGAAGAGKAHRNLVHVQHALVGVLEVPHVHRPRVVFGRLRGELMGVGVLGRRRGPSSLTLPCHCSVLRL